MRLAVILAVPSLVFGLSGCVEGVQTGRTTYGDLCAGCHGPGGKGDGPIGAWLAVKPANLTQIAARNGGLFPRVAVMGKIYGFARGEERHGAMPAFGTLLEGRKVLIDNTGDGVLTPTPEPLVKLTAYIEGLQK